MRKIFLVTNQYPYSYTEQFIETEIKFWDKLEIEIIPSKLADSSRDVNGIHIRTTVAMRLGSFRKFDFFHIVKTIFSPYVLKELVRSPKIFVSISKLKTLFRFEYLTQRYCSAIKNDFSNEELKGALFYTYWFDWQTCALTRLRKSFDFKIITRCHRADLYAYTQPGGYMPYSKNYYTNIDTIYSISQDGVDYLHNTFAIERCKLKVARLGVPERNILRNFDARSKHDIHILSVSYVKPVKRVLLIAKMLNQYATENPKLKITWTHFGDGPEFNELKKLVSNFSFKVNLMGMCNNSDVINYYESNHINIFVNLSLSEGVPVSIMEAISFGVPVVATDCGGTSEIVNEQIGKLIPIKFVYEDFSIAIESALETSPIVILEQFKEKYCAEVNYKVFRQQLISRAMDENVGTC
ncbi:hypothetical protein BCU83_17865 [Vibrio breoganii]|uniref:glycosyltransferase n=1 Tax=Vibrio breoganii TaxID=553239 RepID=UPI000C84B23D|nr:glycosyltransferase [Vibrio breoganii]PMG75197.1 hypothetical protein BCU83_17865 [Vibrio breoganii]